MAVLDRRLIPVIEMLTDVGLDWLAFELVEGIRRGREPEETSEALAVARDQVRNGRIESVRRDRGTIPEGSLFVDDEQIEWAARYVDERLGSTLAEMSVALDNIDRIVTNTRDGTAQTSSDFEATIVLHDAEDDTTIGRAQVEEARAKFLSLKEALATWLAHARSDHTL